MLKNNWGVFSVSSPQALLTKLLSPPLVDMLRWAVWFKFLLTKSIANTCLFILTSFSKQSASWKVLEICELCALSNDSRKTYSVNKYMYTGSSSYSFDWGGGGIIRWGRGRNEKDPTTENHKLCSKQKFLRILSSLKWCLFETSRINIIEVRRFCTSMYWDRRLILRHNFRCFKYLLLRFCLHFIYC